MEKDKKKTPSESDPIFKEGDLPETEGDLRPVENLAKPVVENLDEDNNPDDSDLAEEDPLQTPEELQAELEDAFQPPAKDLSDKEIAEKISGLNGQEIVCVGKLAFGNNSTPCTEKYKIEAGGTTKCPECEHIENKGRRLDELVHEQNERAAETNGKMPKLRPATAGADGDDPKEPTEDEADGEGAETKDLKKGQRFTLKDRVKRQGKSKNKDIEDLEIIGINGDVVIVTTPDGVEFETDVGYLNKYYNMAEGMEADIMNDNEFEQFMEALEKEKKKEKGTTWAGNAAEWMKARTGDAAKGTLERAKTGANLGLLLSYWIFYLTFTIAEEGASFNSKNFKQTIVNVFGTDWVDDMTKGDKK